MNISFRNFHNMKRFGFKKILSHYRNSNDNKPISEKPIETPGHSQDDSSELATGSDLKPCPIVKPAVEKARSTVRPLEPTVRGQFVLGARRERSKKPKLSRYPGGMCKLCPVCGQQTIATGLPPDGHNCICSTCNAKIQVALESFKNRQEMGQVSAPEPAPAPAPAPATVLGPVPAMAATSSHDRSEPPPFSIVVLQDCENSALIDQLTTALARTCPQYNKLHSNNSNNNNNNNNNNSDYNSDYNDMCENEYEDGYVENRPPPNSMPGYGYDQPQYNPNQVYYDETQNRTYDSPRNRHYSSRQNNWAGHEDYNNFYPMQNNMAASSRTSLYTGVNPAYNYERQYSGTTICPGAQQCQYNRASNAAYNECPCRGPSEDQSNNDTGCQGQTCEQCRQVCESNNKLIMLIAQALELFIANRMSEANRMSDTSRMSDTKSEKHPKGRKSKRGSAAAGSGKECRPGSSNLGISAKSSATKSAYVKDNTRGKSPNQFKERTKAQPKDKANPKLNNQKFCVPVQEQTRPKCAPCECNCKATSCPSTCEAACSTLLMNSGASGSSGHTKQAGKAACAGGARGRRSRGSRNSKSPAGSTPPENAAQSCCCSCGRHADRFGGGDAAGRCCAARRANGLQPVAHYRPGMLQFPTNYMLQRNGEWVRRSLVRTAAGATLHERPHSDNPLPSEPNACRNPVNAPCQGCRSNYKFCR